MSNRLLAPESHTVLGAADQTSSAVGHLVGFLKDSARSLRIDAQRVSVEQLLDSEGVAGHIMTVPAPLAGFDDEVRSTLELYCRSLVYWKKLLISFEWREDSVLITFRRAEAEAADEDPEKTTWRERMRSRAYKGARAIGRTLAGQAFMIREPVNVSMMTLDRVFNGVAIMVKYPYAKVEDRAGIEQAYDRWVPMLADIYSRQFKVRSETLREMDLTTIFFTTDSGYVSAMFDKSSQLRLITAKARKQGTPVFSSSTARACRALSKLFAKHFTTLKKPLPAWGVVGHTMVLRYKPGAAGKILDDSYFQNVSAHAEKIMKRYHVQGLIKHQPETRSLVVTFFTGIDFI